MKAKDTSVGATLKASGKQHVQAYRKIGLRKRLLRFASSGAAFVPFIGDGDIAVELYSDRIVYGADLDPARVATARGRLGPGAVIEVFDCNRWPFPRERAKFSIGDFDAYNNPWPSFEAFWTNAKKTNRLVVFFTDGRVNMLGQSGWFEGVKLSITERRKVFNFYALQQAKPRLARTIAPWRVTMFAFYRRGGMYYMGAVLDKP